MELETLVYFMELSEKRNYSLVAAERNISQSSLSKAIMRLEDELNVELFDRSFRPIELTPAGKVLYKDLKEIEPLMKKTILHIQAFSDKNFISCCTVPSFTGFDLVNKLPLFYNKNGNIHIDFSKTTEIEEGIDRLKSGEVDLLIAHRALHDIPWAEVTFLAKDQLYVVIPKESPLSDKKHITISELAGCQLIETRFGNSIVKQLIDFLGLSPKSVECRMGVRREAILQSIVYEKKMMICFDSDVNMFKMDKVKTVPITLEREMPFVLYQRLEKKTNIEWIHKFKVFLLKEVYVGYK